MGQYRESGPCHRSRLGRVDGGGTGRSGFLDGLPTGPHAQQIATFDTRVAKMRHLPGSAAKAAAKVAHRHGFERAEHVESFYVDDMEGPLLDGELVRAAAWGREIGAGITQRVR